MSILVVIFNWLDFVEVCLVDKVIDLVVELNEISNFKVKTMPELVKVFIVVLTKVEQVIEI